MLDEGGAELSCSVRGPRSLLGLETLVAESSAYRVWALSDVKICEAPRDRLRQWTGSLETPLGVLVRLGVEEANRRASERLDVGGAAVARIARLLLRRCVENARTHLELSQRLLARVLSMTPETVSRAVAKLHAAGAVTSTRPIVIGDVDALRRFTRE
jgi:CRP-like cAMP-binding protein